MATIQPVGTNILAKLPERTEHVTKSGLVIAADQRDDTPILEIIAVGPDVIAELQAGVKIVATGVDTMLKVDDQVLLQEADVLGIIEA